MKLTAQRKRLNAERAMLRVFVLLALIKMREETIFLRACYALAESSILCGKTLRLTSWLELCASEAAFSIFNFVQLTLFLYENDC